MSIQAMVHVMKESKQSGASYTLMLMIANYADARGLNAYPSISTLARDSRILKRTVQLLLPMLEASGELKIHRGEGCNGTHVYEVVMQEGGVERTPNPIGDPIRIRNKEKEDIYISLPDWLDPELWKGFVEHRSQMQKDKVGRLFTQRAQEGALRILTKLRAAGHDPRLVIERSIDHQWLSFFDLPPEMRGDEDIGARAKRIEDQIKQEEEEAAL